MKSPLQQGWLDSLCGVYSIVNANRLVNNVSHTDSQPLFNLIIEKLHKKRLLHRVILEGINHKNLSWLMGEIGTDVFPLMETNKRGFLSLNDWWQYSRDFLETPNRTIILSIGGLHDHLSVVQKVGEKSITLFDSDGFKSLRKSQCKLYGYQKKDKYIIYYSQCWYLGRE